MNQEVDLRPTLNTQPAPSDGVLVLTSGGLDSSTLLAYLRSEGTPVAGLFVDFGQPAAASEQSAARFFCDALGATFLTIEYRGRCVKAGELRGRNALLVHMALLEFPFRSGAIGIGIHAGTTYRDCSPPFVDLMQTSLDFHTGGSVGITSPFVAWTKADILALAVQLDLLVTRTYSCERANTPCDRCPSCSDRRALGLV